MPIAKSMQLDKTWVWPIYIIETNLINYLNQEFLIFARNFLSKPGTSRQNQELIGKDQE